MMEDHYIKEHKMINLLEKKAGLLMEGQDQINKNSFAERACRNFKRNLDYAKKTKEIAAKKTEMEIERRRKAQEIRNQHYQIKFCNEIYQRALVLEKEKNLEKMKKKREQNKKENEDRRLQMEKIENYYKDQIKLLREILLKEKQQQEIEHRAHIQFLSKIAKEKKNEYKKELDDIFDRFEQEERKNEFERKNRKQLNKIFESYYGNK